MQRLLSFFKSHSLEQTTLTTMLNLSWRDIALLLAAPFLWAANAVVGRLIYAMVPPLTLNFFRWAIAFAILFPLTRSLFRRDNPLWRYSGRYALLGLLGIGLYNALLYKALQTSTPVNVTLVGASMPVCMLLVGALFFGVTVRRWQVMGAALSISGVVVVLCRGDVHQLWQLRLVEGDLFMLVATFSWAFYSWLLSRTAEPTVIRQDWKSFLMAQMVFGVVWAGALALLEQTTMQPAPIAWSWWLAVAIIFIALGPALLAYRCWGLAVQKAGPTTAGFFANFIPLFAAVLSMPLLSETPKVFHAVAFALVAGGITLSSRSSDKT